MVRAEDTAPCTNCGAPPVQAMPQNTNWSTASPQRGLLSRQQQNSIGTPLSGFWQQPQSLHPQWSQVQQERQAPQENSLLPVPYQGNTNFQNIPQPNTMQVVPAPEQNITIAPPHYEEGVVYVPPMYFKPRPIIPRYRIISGFLSVIIVSLLLCGGAGYYAKASGKLDMVSRVLTGTNSPPVSIRPTAPSLPDPSDKVDIGTTEAHTIIPSATTTAHLIKGTTIAAQTDRIFKPNVTFYLTYSVYPPKTGTVTIKWYMNNLQLPYSTTPGKPLSAGQPVTGIAAMVYAEQAEGKVELYWNDQLAQALYFVVRN